MSNSSEVRSDIARQRSATCSSRGPRLLGMKETLVLISPAVDAFLDGLGGGDFERHGRKYV
eukprot:3838091-Pyramimonas_sp.AAC.1